MLAAAPVAAPRPQLAARPRRLQGATPHALQARPLGAPPADPVGPDAAGQAAAELGALGATVHGDFRRLSAAELAGARPPLTGAQLRERITLAATVATLGKADLQRLAEQWRRSEGRGTPRARAASLSPGDAQGAVINELARRESQNWHKSTVKYSSLVRPWGTVYDGVAPWSPSETSLGAFAIAVQLVKYLSQVRSVLRLVNAPLGAPRDMAELGKGASKGPQADRYKPQAPAKQTRDLSRHWRANLGEPDLADVVVVARHCCL
ncbi:unnamed protein product, partial [Prorocentrum cordatum]